MGGKSSTWLAMAFVVCVFGTIGYLVFRASTFPNLAVSSASETLNIDEVRGEKAKLVLVLLIPGDPVSKAAAELLKAEYATYEGSAAFAGVLVSSPTAAAAYEKALELPYPVYSLVGEPQRELYMEMLKAVGGATERVPGGTVLFLDKDRLITKNVSGTDLMGLPDKLKKL